MDQEQRQRIFARAFVAQMDALTLQDEESRCCTGPARFEGRCRPIRLP
jgi:hypothetical protein